MLLCKLILSLLPCHHIITSAFYLPKQSPDILHNTEYIGEFGSYSSNESYCRLLLYHAFLGNKCRSKIPGTLRFTQRISRIYDHFYDSTTKIRKQCSRAQTPVYFTILLIEKVNATPKTSKGRVYSYKHGGCVYPYKVAVTFSTDTPNGEVTGQQISASSLDDVAKKIKDAIKPTIYPEIKKERLDNRDVIRVDFSGKEKPYSSFGRYYKRVFDRTEEITPDELKRMMAETDRSSHWENNLTKYGLDAVDKAALEEFYKRAVSCGRLEEQAAYNAEELLTGLGLYEQGKLTNAGYYLFSNQKPVVLKLAVYVTDERINFSDIDRIEDNIFNLIRKGYCRPL